MRTLAQTVLPFKLGATDELLTANAGLVLFGEFVRGLGFNRWLSQEMPRPGSGRGYAASAYLNPLVLMLTGGGRSLEDLRTLKGDAALATLLKHDTLPSTDAVGDWLRRTGSGAGLMGLDRINQRTVATRIRQTGITAHTLDIDATQIVAEKEAAHFTYQGETGYMPMVGHLAEAGVVIHDEFRAMTNFAKAISRPPRRISNSSRPAKPECPEDIASRRCASTPQAIRQASSITWMPPARPSLSVLAWMRRHVRSLPPFPNRPGRPMPIAGWPRPRIA